MLEQLTIRNLALLGHTGLLPSDGLTVISGETGGGKSLVVSALRLLRGEKARSGLVRRGAKSATIDAVFRLSKGERSRAVRELYEEVLGTGIEDDRMVVSRILDAGGRSRARIDGRPVALRELVRFGAYLLEIHGQGANRSLMRPEIQTELLDAFAGIRAERERFAGLLRDARVVAGRLEKLRSGQRESKERRDFLRYCLSDVKRVDPQPGEYGRLRAEDRILGNLDRLRQGLAQGLLVLHDSEEQAPVIDSVAGLAREIEALTETDPRLAQGAKLLDEATVLLEEAAHELRDGLGRLELDEGRVEELRERLSELSRLLERFGPDEDALFETLGRMREELDALEGDAADPSVVETELGELCAELEKSGKKLERSRTRASRKLSKSMASELADLGMQHAEVDVRVVPNEGRKLLDRATELGLCRVEVHLAPNPGEPMTPLRETASGGEVARVMLVLKKILADADRVPVLVFDEADAEIGGRLSLAVGKKLADVAAKHQVLCITHQPLIAARADKHFLVKKRVEQDAKDGERTLAELRLLTGEARRHELASMSRGDSAIDQAALEEADRLLDLASDH